MSSDFNDDRSADILKEQLAILQVAPSLTDETVRQQAVDFVLELVRSRCLDYHQNLACSESNHGEDGSSSDNGTDLLELIQSTMSILFSVLGPVNEQLLHFVLELLGRTLTSPALLQSWGDALSTLALATADNRQSHKAILETLRSVWMETKTGYTIMSLLPVVNCLAQVSADTTRRLPLFVLLQDTLTTLVSLEESVTAADLTALVQEMLNLVSNPSEALLVWSALRNESCRFIVRDENDDSAMVLAQHCIVDWDCWIGAVAPVVALSMKSPYNGETLASAYVEILESIPVLPGRADEPDQVDPSTAQCDNDSVPLDLLVALLLCTLSPDQYSDKVDRIIDQWIGTWQPSAALFPWLNSLLRVECIRKHEQQLGLDTNSANVAGSETYCRAMRAGLIRTSVLLLLAPVRCTNASLNHDALKSVTHKFIVDLHQERDRDQQDELIFGLLEMTDLGSWLAVVDKNATIGMRRGCNAMRLNHESKTCVGDARTEIPRSAIMILTSLALRAPSSLLRFKTALLTRLTRESACCSSPSLTKEWCTLLTTLSRPHESGTVAVVQALCSAELSALVHKLLFNGSVSGDTGRMARGIILATELLRCADFLDKDSIQMWVLRLLLPTTRRMMDPELGSPGLNFLKAAYCWAEIPDQDSLFRHFKMILANTGLIQMLSSYKASSQETDTILGYSDMLESMKLSVSSKREMVFCVNFFLGHTFNMVNNPSRWHFATNWAFELVSTYLQMGRQRTPSWRPDSWLVASLEFPTLVSGRDNVNTLPNSVADWIQDDLCRFDVRGGSQQSRRMPGTQIGSAVASMRNRDRYQWHDFISRFSLSVLVGISLSAAVLKNAYDHYRIQRSDRNTAQKMTGDSMFLLIKLQLLKVYDLFAKSELLDSLARSIEARLTRIASRPNESIILETLPDQQGLAYPTLLAGMNEMYTQVHSLRFAMYARHDMFDVSALWEVLEDPDENKTLKDCFTALLDCRTPSAHDSALPCFRVIDLKLKLLKQVTALLSVESPSLQSTATARQNHFMHCAKTVVYLLDVLPKLRKGYFALREVSSVANDEDEQVSVDNVLRLLIWYIRALASLLRYISRHGSMKLCEEWCDISHSVAMDRPLQSSRCRLFNFFGSLLPSAIYSVVSNHLLEILSIISLHDSDCRVDRLAELSWVSLRTVSVDSGIEEETYDFIPSILTEFMKRFDRRSTSIEEQVLYSVVSRTVSHLGNTTSGNLQHAMVRHWGMLLATDSAVLQTQHLSRMIVEVELLLDSLNNTGRETESAEKMGLQNCRHRKLKRHEATLVMGLETATFPTYFETLLQIVIASSATLYPHLQENPDEGPYRHIQESFALFQRLVEVYKRHFRVFPRKCGFSVSRASKDVLAVATSQVNRCVAWRRDQPMLSANERNSTVCDPGAILFLQSFLDEVSLTTTATVTALCNFWQSMEDTQKNPPKSATLRYAAETTAARIREVAASHNLVPSLATRTTRSRRPISSVSGNCDQQLPVTVCGTNQASSEELERPHTVRLTNSDSDSDDSDNSFVADGAWGGKSKIMQLQCAGLLQRS